MNYPEKKLIISADDFGMNPLANKNILILAEAGKLDRVSVMTNGFFSTQEIERLKRTGVCLDIHLELIYAIFSGRKIERNFFTGYNIFIKLYF